jgi:hypothetical protein
MTISVITIDSICHNPHISGVTNKQQGDGQMNVTVTIDKIEKPKDIGYAQFYVEATLSYGAINKPPKQIQGVRAYTEHGDASIYRYCVSNRQIKVEPLLRLINEAIDKAAA